MSLIIKGMEMPKRHLFEAFVAIGDGQIVVKDLEKNKLFEGKIEEVRTPHGRLIDADANVGSYVETWTCNCSEFGTQRVMAVDDLKYLSTIIEAEVSE